MHSEDIEEEEEERVEDKFEVINLDPLGSGAGERDSAGASLIGRRGSEAFRSIRDTVYGVGEGY